MTNRFQRLGLICAAAAMAICMSSAFAAEPAPAGPLVNEPIAEGNVYQCFKDLNHYDRTFCTKIGTTTLTPAATPADLAELQAAEEAAVFVIPVRPRATWWDGEGMTEYCRGSTHGDCSGYCRITAVLPNGDVIVECGER